MMDHATANETPLAEGWGWPLLSRKAHYFVKHRALCGRWLYMGVLENDKHDSPDNCTACNKRRASRVKAAAKQGGA